MPVDQFIFTHRPRGAGEDKAAQGFQVAASSPGLAADNRANEAVRGALYQLGMQQRVALYDNGPGAAREAEQQWRAQMTDAAAAPPADVVRLFPCVHSYTRLPDERYALSQFAFHGNTPDELHRPGNVLGHGFVFTPEELTPCGSHPLALVDAGRLRGTDLPNQTSLPTVAGFADVPARKPDPAPLLQAPFGSQAAVMLTALAQAQAAARPLVIVVSDWRTATPLVGALLDLLPPTRRRQTTFTTYEHEPATRNRATEGRCPFDLMVCSTEQPYPLQLGVEDYSSRLFILNFAEGRHSEGAASAYAQFAVDCARRGDMATLGRYHELIEGLEAGDSPELWDGLLAALDLCRDGGTTPHSDIAAAVSAAVRSPVGAAYATQELLPILFGDAQRGDLATTRATSRNMKPMTAALSPADKSRVHSQIAKEAHRALEGGQARIAAALLEADPMPPGLAEVDALRDFVVAEPPRVPPVASAEDQVELGGILVRATRCTHEAGDRDLVDALLPAACEVSVQAGLGMQVWGELRQVVEWRLAPPWQDEQKTLAQRLTGSLTAAACPQAARWLQEARLEHGGLAVPAQVDAFAELAHCCCVEAKPEDAARRLIERAEASFDKLSHRIYAAGRMADAAEQHEDPKGPEQFYEHYWALVEPLEANVCRQVWEKLAELGATRVLARELLRRRNRADEPQRRQLQNEWRGLLLHKHPEVLDQLCARAASPTRDREQVLALAEWLIPEAKHLKASGQGLRALLQAVVNGLAIAPLTNSEAELLAGTEGLLSPETAARLRLLTFMRDAQRARRGAGAAWTPAHFDATHAVWSHELRQAPMEVRTQALNWGVALMADGGLWTAQDAENVLAGLRAAGLVTPSDLAGPIRAFVASTDRDPVTRVQIATAFVLHAAEKLQEGEVLDVAMLIADGLDRESRALFERHLEKRLGHRPPAYDKLVLRFVPHLATAPAAVPLQPPQGGQGPPPPLVPPDLGKAVGGIFKRARNLLMGEPSQPEAPEDTRRSQPTQPTPSKPPEKGKKGGGKG